MTLVSANFSFLADQDPKLLQFGALAERYFTDDPSTSLFKVRQFAELLAKSIAARQAAYQGERESFEETLRRLIVRRVERAFTWIEDLAAEAFSARKLIDRLDQAILAKAFRGALVPQDPSDEPASVLLDRIRAERATAGEKAKRRKRRVADGAS